MTPEYTQLPEVTINDLHRLSCNVADRLMYIPQVSDSPTSWSLVDSWISGVSSSQRQALESISRNTHLAEISKEELIDITNCFIDGIIVTKVLRRAIDKKDFQLFEAGKSLIEANFEESARISKNESLPIPIQKILCDVWEKEVRNARKSCDPSEKAIATLTSFRISEILPKDIYKGKRKTRKELMRKTAKLTSLLSSENGV